MAHRVVTAAVYPNYDEKVTEVNIMGLNDALEEGFTVKEFSVTHAPWHNVAMFFVTYILEKPGEPTTNDGHNELFKYDKEPS